MSERARERSGGHFVQDEVGVDSGAVEVRVGSGGLRASAIGSCVVVAAYDSRARVAGMAHVMLPGVFHGPDPSRKTRYAADAVEVLDQEMAAAGADLGAAATCLVGGGNVLGDGDVSPGPETVQSLVEILSDRGITPVALEVGGTQRRSCSLNAATGRVLYTVGDSTARTLWKPNPRHAVRDGHREVRPQARAKVIP